MSVQRWLRQLKTGRIYPWAPVIAKRKDMVPYDPAMAQARIDALRSLVKQREAVEPSPEEQAAHVASVQEAQRLAKELTDIENEAFGETPKETRVENADPPPDATGQSAEDQAEKERERTIENDPHVQEIMKMDKPAQVIEYLKREFGLVVDPKGKKIEALKNMAVNHRIERIFEG